MGSERTFRVLHPTLSPLRFISVEAGSGIVLLLAAAVALAWANSPWSAGYAALWHVDLLSALARYLPEHDLHFAVNDGLMTVFFLLVGLEIRRELHDGTLSDPKVATLPIVAALGGVIAPAVIYVLLNRDPATRHGWGIPTATDIAFAVGVLSLLGRGIPPALRMLLLTLAIIDDIVAILVIAFFYSSGIAWAGLAIVAGGVVLVLLMQWAGIGRALFYTVPGAVVWYGLLYSGVHPTLAGVMLGLLTPATARFGGRWRRDEPAPEELAPVTRVEARLHPYVAFGIMPLFALANAGVSLAGLELSSASALAVSSGIVAGLVAGKPVGVLLASFLAVRVRLCALPPGLTWGHALLLGLLAGIGFTMAIFIANLAFSDARLLAVAKFAILLASALAATLGFIFGRLLPGIAHASAIDRSVATTRSGG
ncbi:MAG TPA: Na+/H+ antiporter NhaA [Steroidobacteraceae bacterium]|jgi:NhaA family Na+:H+ antiporter|nr:Na+/H+ antiporter NhaA [Steroidobacteraceae bacterium]